MLEEEFHQMRDSILLLSLEAILLLFSGPRCSYYIEFRANYTTGSFFSESGLSILSSFFHFPIPNIFLVDFLDTL